MQAKQIIDDYFRERYEYLNNRCRKDFGDSHQDAVNELYLKLNTIPSDKIESYYANNRIGFFIELTITQLKRDSNRNATKLHPLKNHLDRGVEYREHFANQSQSREITYDKDKLDEAIQDAYMSFKTSNPNEVNAHEFNLMVLMKSCTMSMRQMERETGIHRNTIARIKKKAIKKLKDKLNENEV
jgi:DNA-directed RNA polymerase specialized sigma subunit